MADGARRRFVMSSSDGSFDADATPQSRLWARCVATKTPSSCAGGRSTRRDVRARVPRSPTAMGDEAVAALADRVNRWGISVGADLWTPLPGSGRIDPWRVPEFLSTVVDRESVDGLVWDVAQDVRAIKVSQDGMDVDVSVESTESDWFDLNVRVRVGDHLLSVREALEAIARGDDYVEAHGVWVRLDGRVSARWLLCWTRLGPLRGGRARACASLPCRWASTSLREAGRLSVALGVVAQAGPPLSVDEAGAEGRRARR